MSKNMYRLTNPQKSIWHTEQFYKGTSIENISGTTTILEKVDFKKFEMAINLFIEKNDSFRLRFIINNNEVKQYLEDYSYISFEKISVSSEKDVKKIEDELSNTPFDILNSFLFKFVLFEFPDGHGGFVVSMHHLISDAWTSGILVNETMNIYDLLLNNQPVSKEKSPSYLDYISSEFDYLSSEKFEKDKVFWNNLFNTIPEVATIPSMNNTSVSCKAKRKQFTINNKLMNLISEFCKSQKVSEFNFFMGIISIYLGRVSSLDEFVIGTPILNRSNFKEKHTAGMFISVVPFKVTLNSNSTFAEFISGISKSFFNIFRHQKYSYQTLLEDLRKQNGNDLPNLFKIMLSYQNMRTNKQTSNINYEATWSFSNNISDDLDIHFFDINDTGNIIMAYDYKTDIYSIDDIYSIHERILNIINQVLQNSEILLKDIEIVTPTEKRKILYEFNDTKADYPREKTIAQLFEEQVLKTPDNTAVVFGNEHLTYKELNERANSLAHYLIKLGIKNGDIIPVLLNRSLDLIISMISIIKVGATYLPLSNEYPAERLKYILNDCNSKYIISNTKNYKLINNKLTIINLDNINFNKYSTKNINNIIKPSNILYIIYTSGSTGNPKGVRITHQNLNNFIHSFNNLFKKISNNDKILSSTNICFDVSIFEFYISLLNGCKLYLYEENTITNIFKYCDFIIKNKITMLYIPPNILEEVYDILKKENYKLLDKLLIGVEPIKSETIKKYYSLNPDIKIINGYGPTETTICATAFEVDENILDKYGIIPIGKPLSNLNLYVLDKNMNICPINVPGELYISGDNVSSGYLNNEDLTNKVFIKLPFNNSISYKTGDIVRWDNDGIINFIGRNDSQVKIHGHRIELGEINNTIRLIKNVKNSITIIKNVNNIPCICSYIVTDSGTDDLSNIKTLLRKELPTYMIPAYITKIDAIPLTSNGKIDIKQLPDININLEEKYESPSSNLEIQLSNIIFNVFNVNCQDINISFFDIGLDSLSAIRLCAELYSMFGLKISSQEIFEHSTIKTLANYIENNSIIDNKALIKKTSKNKKYPVSSAQKRIYFACNMDSDNSILYNIPGGIIFDKMPDVKKLELCLNELVNRHESFRTYFEIVNNELIQKIENKINFKLNISDSIIKYEDLKKEFDDFVKPFDLSKPPLFRAKLLKLDNGNVAFFIDMHHIISDGTSVSILVDELCKLYNGQNLNELNITYKDYAKWENDKLKNGDFKEAEDYWVNQFENDIPILDMPTNYIRPTLKSYIGNKVHAKLNEEITGKINIFCKQNGITPYMFFLSIYYILLYKYSHQNNIVIGSPIVGRNNADMYNIIGMFVNSLPMKIKIEPNLYFKEFVNAVKSMCLKNYEYQDYPFDELVNKLNIQRDTSRNPLFDVMFIYQNNGNPAISFNEINSKYYIPDTKISKFDLSLEIIPENNLLNLSFEYSTSLFNKDFITHLSNHYINIINTILKNQKIKISDIDMLSEKEKNKILYEFNDTKMDYPKEKTISQLFEEQVEKTPNNIAVVFENNYLTYKELNEKSNSLAHYLRDNGINRNDLVGIMVNRSLEMIISIIAVLKSGGAYIPIDPEYPEDRIKYMLNNSNAKLLLTQEKLKDNIEFNNKLCVDLSINEIYNINFSNLNNINTPEDLIYVIYTSGSTGLPKGVMLKNKNVVNFIYATTKRLNLPTNSTIVSLTTISFDIFVLESLLPLLNGMKIIIASELAQTDVKLFNDLCIKNDVDIIQTTPSRIQALLYDESSTNFIKKVKYLLIGGEPFPSKLLEKLHSIYNEKIFNMYGPTETAVWSSIKDLSNTSQITIGTPIGNTQMYILDQFNNPLPAGIPGELFISGEGLAKGYLNNLSLTNKVFISNPFLEGTKMYKTGDLCKLLPNGEIEYIERADNQIKIRGLRIELGEIENKIISYPYIKNACVIKQTINTRDFISAYFTATKRINISELRKYLSKYLPKYMIPAYFTVLDDFPYTPNGKINKKMLPLPKEILNSDKPNEYIAPKTELEKKFVSIWEKILNIKPIGINDNFFELGGDSILAMNLNIELKKLTDSISYSDIFKFPTISELIKKSKSKDDNYDFNYMNKNYNKYINLLNLNINVPKFFDLKYKTSGNILLTGATGFLGMHILDNFIKNEKGNIYCLIREEPGLTSQTKLLQKLNYYFGNKYDKLIGKRIFAITGNITTTGFGLNQDNLLSLANNIDIVINTAARVSHYGNYSDFYNTNVKSVKNIIDFCKSFNKKFYHISTLSVSGNALDSGSIKQNMEKTTYFKENNLYIGQSLENVYVRSKFEAECLILDAILDGLDAYILRVGNLMPRFKDGIFQENIVDNAFINRIVSFIKLGAIPDYLLDGYLEFTPIDTISNAIIKLITHPCSNNRIFHLFNHNHIYINKCVKYFKLLNPDIKILPENNFKKIIKSTLNNEKKKDILNSLINDLDSDLHLLYKTDIIIKSEVTINYLSKIGFSWPKINDKYILRFIELLRRYI